jgi:hypothetical protein
LALRIALAHGHGFFFEFGFAIGVGEQHHFGKFSHIGFAIKVVGFKAL